HLWDMPPIVEEYLTTRNESIRSAALDAALAASSASWAAARAALDAASAAARDALDAASAAARDALDARAALAQKQEFLKIVGLNY
ncbi:MAG TPA: hypothetical protein PLB05_05205, partial [Candidatus Omnitrophota bacterium]|nr:hypothetical protein [Candidatus Omnitrophota bacterium]